VQLPIAEWLERGTWAGEGLDVVDVELVDARREPVRVAA
jgi:hypothetical protein